MYLQVDALIDLRVVGLSPSAPTVKQVHVLLYHYCYIILQNNCTNLHAHLAGLENFLPVERWEMILCFHLHFPDQSGSLSIYLLAYVNGL